MLKFNHIQKYENVDVNRFMGVHMSGKELLEKVTQNIGKVIIGKEEIITLLLTALLADGHVLLEDVPGTGKTKLAKSLAKSLDAQKF